MQEYLGADKLNGCTAEEEHHLSQQHQPHRPDVLSPDTRVYDGLREKRENELQQRAEQQAKYQLREEAFVLLEIVPEKFHSPLSRHCFRVVLSIKLFCRFKKKGNTFLLAIGLSTHPMLAEFLLSIGYKSFSRICHINFISITSAFLYLINNHKVVLDRKSVV